MRKYLRKLIPDHAVLPLIITALTLIASYQGAKWVQMLTHNANTLDMTIGLDHMIPLQPVWVLVYFGSYFFWIWQYLVLTRHDAKIACTMAAADIVAKGICLVCYLTLPATLVRPEITGDGLLPTLMRLLYFIDTPTNLFPSTHCMVPWLATRCLLKCKDLNRKNTVCIVSFIGTLMVFASTVFTKQHVVVDIFAGVAVAEIGLLAAKLTPLTRTVENWNRRFMDSKLINYL